jgi:hypothetical protein
MSTLSFAGDEEKSKTFIQWRMVIWTMTDINEKGNKQQQTTTIRQRRSACAFNSINEQRE